MDRLDAALERYEQIRRSADSTESAANGETLSRWVSMHVCPVVRTLMKRGDFRQLAKWSTDTLSAGSGTTARKLVDTIDRQLVETARQLAELFEQSPKIVEAMSNEGNASPDSSYRESPGLDEAPNFIATRPWRDLVAADDYFGPVADLNLREGVSGTAPGSDQVQIGEFMTFLQPHLRRTGDYVVEAMLIRIEYWRGALHRLLIRCKGSIQNRDDISPETREELRNTHVNIEKPLQELKELLLFDDRAPLRRSCTALVQASAAFNPKSDFSWLGAAAQLVSNASLIRYWIEQRSDRVISDQIAAALAEVAEFYRSEPDIGLSIAEKVLEHRFVLVHGRGNNQLFWQQMHVEIVHTSREWTLMVALAENAVFGRGVDAVDGLGISLKDAKYGLKSLLPDELFASIVPGEGGYRLDIPVDQLFVARIDQSEQLEEIG